MRPDSSDRLFAIAATAAVVISIVIGFSLLGSPIKQRRVRSDQQRLQDLYAISETLYAQLARSQELNEPIALPTELPDTVQTTDPISGDAYIYRPLGETEYELCATFETDSSDRPPRGETPPGYEFWQHPLGEHCFQMDALKQLPYPPY